MMKKLLIVILVFGLIACGNETQKNESNQETTQKEIEQTKKQQLEEPQENHQTQDDLQASGEIPKKMEGNDIKILVSTDYGEIMLKLYSKTPGHRDNMLTLINKGWYKNSPFHRVINNFMIQGGWNESGSKDPGYTIPGEFVPDYIHKKGALAAARLGDQVNPNKESSGCQFYIVQGKKANDNELNMIEKRGGFKYTPEQRKIYKTIGGTPFLDYAYTVFGEVVLGIEVVDKIASVKTGEGDVPVKPIIMNISVLK